MILKMKRFVFTLLLTACSLWIIATYADAKSARVNDVKIDVLVNDSGWADITEVWDIDAISDLTEWYLVETNLGDIEISNFGVFENGKDFNFEGEWDVDRSIEDKAYKCGYVTRDDGYELCWGLGTMGHHVFTVRYTLSNFIKAFDDADGFNHMFVAKGLSFYPEKVSVTIKLAGKELTKSNTRVWSFGHRGEIWVKSGKVEAYTIEPFVSESSMIIMVRFDKKLLNPANHEEGSFDVMRNAALEYSDYGTPTAIDEFFGKIERVDAKCELWLCEFLHDNDWGSSIYTLFKVVRFLILFISGILLFVYGGPYMMYVFTLKPLRIYLYRLHYLGNGKPNLYRDVPFNGNIAKCNYVHEGLSYKIQSHPERITAAMVLRLVQRRVFSLARETNKKGELVMILQVNDWIDYSNNKDESTLEKSLFDIIKAAAGQDNRLQSNELKAWGTESDNRKQLYKWQQALKKCQSFTIKDKYEIQKLYGLKQFLKDFTLINERGMVEVNLWNEYLVFATVFGIADQVRQDFKKVCPEYFEMTKDVISPDEIDSSTETLSDFSLILWTSVNMSSYHSRPVSSDSSWGGGGGSSWGGGGGFSGGGSGGGGR